MQPVPDRRASKTKDVSDHSRDRDQDDGCGQIERFDEVDWLDHVRPEDEIENWLRPANHNKDRPGDVPAADQQSDH